jgi:hypothetical protein
MRHSRLAILAAVVLIAVFLRSGRGKLRRKVIVLLTPMQTSFRGPQEWQSISHTTQRAQ